MRCFLKTECRKPCAAHSIGPDNGCCSGLITKKQTFRVVAKCIHDCFCLNVLHSRIQVDRTGVSLALLTQKVLHTRTCTCKGHRCSQSMSKYNVFLLITLVVGNNTHRPCSSHFFQPGTRPITTESMSYQLGLTKTIHICILYIFVVFQVRGISICY